jgi:hypothetical protein
VTAASSVAAMPPLGGRWPRWPLWVAAGLLAVGLLMCVRGLGGEPRGPGMPSFSPSAAPLPRPGEPARFEAPPGLDGKSAKDWRKVAEKVHDGELEEARHKLRDFERKHGTSAESARLRQWLEQQPGDEDE